MTLASTKTIVTNVVVTFVEGFLAAWVTTGNSLTKHALVGAAASGASIVWNTVLKPFAKSRGWL